MNLSIPNLGARWQALAALFLLGITGCVPTSDYEALQKENRELQKSLDTLHVQMRQLQAQLQLSQLQQAQALEIQKQLEQAKKELEARQEEMRQLQERFEKFKGERRKALVGRQFSEIALDDGRRLIHAEITSMIDGQLAIRHETGITKVTLAQGGEELRWLACFDDQEAADSARLERLNTAKRIEKQLQAARSQPEAAETATTGRIRSSAEEAAALRRIIESQRLILNQSYQRLSAENPAALRGSNWNSTRPEDSGLINVFAERRAVLGLSELDNLASAIKANLRKLRDLETVSP